MRCGRHDHCRLHVPTVNFPFDSSLLSLEKLNVTDLTWDLRNLLKSLFPYMENEDITKVIACAVMRVTFGKVADLVNQKQKTTASAGSVRLMLYVSDAARIASLQSVMSNIMSATMPSPTLSS